MSFDGPLIPMGAEVRYMPISAKDKARTHMFGDKLLNGIFACYGQHAGGRWDKTLLLVDWEELQKQEIASQVRVKRFKAGEVHLVKVAGGFRFPLVEGAIRQPETSSVRGQDLEWELDQQNDDVAGDSHRSERRTDSNVTQTQSFIGNSNF